MVTKGRLLELLVVHQVREHPLPWRIERDWTHEVIASDGVVITKCPTQEEAEGLISLANGREQECQSEDKRSNASVAA